MRVEEKVLEIEKEMEDIYEHRAKYNLKWAYKHSYKMVINFLDESIFNRVEDKINNHINEKENSRLLKKLKAVKNMIVYKSNNYKEINIILGIVEMLISLILILITHNVTEMFIHKYNKYINAAIIVLIFGIFKFTIEGKILRPMLEKHGWKVYKDNIKIVKKNINYVSDIYNLFENKDDKSLEDKKEHKEENIKVDKTLKE